MITLHKKQWNDVLEVDEFTMQDFPDWDAANEYMQTIWHVHPEAVSIATTQFANGGKSIVVKGRYKILMELRTHREQDTAPNHAVQASIFEPQNRHYATTTTY